MISPRFRRLLNNDERAFDRISGLGMETAYIQWDDDHPTGTVDVALDESKTPHFDIVQDVAYDHIQPDPAVLILKAPD